ncbi:MAG: protein-L-isoaspartate(D-aspartate) O-methyltransferase [Candidatus Hydrogenedentes bacterium]|nr:protein-L-isoaspartate(D-aspartate) O-methyltransferase [Candidatus Hydrogenedentota bacterium]
MVESQIAARHVRDERVLDALRAVPRHAFVPEPYRPHAYEDHPIDIGHGQTISQPYMVAVMTQLLALRPTDRVLEIGTGSGYQAAVLASLARHVTSVERIAPLAERARATLDALEYTNVDIYTADGTLGWTAGAPYDAIVVTAGAPAVPESLREQLADGGRLVCPAGPRELQYLVRVVREGDRFREDEGIKCVFVPLIGAEGWPG